MRWFWPLSSYPLRSAVLRRNALTRTERGRSRAPRVMAMVSPPSSAVTVSARVAAHVDDVPPARRGGERPVPTARVASCLRSGRATVICVGTGNTSSAQTVADDGTRNAPSVEGRVSAKRVVGRALVTAPWNARFALHLPPRRSVGSATEFCSLPVHTASMPARRRPSTNACFVAAPTAKSAKRAVGWGGAPGVTVEVPDEYSR